MERVEVGWTVPGSQSVKVMVSEAKAGVSWAVLGRELRARLGARSPCSYSSLCYPLGVGGSLGPMGPRNTESARRHGRCICLSLALFLHRALLSCGRHKVSHEA